MVMLGRYGGIPVAGWVACVALVLGSLVACDGDVSSDGGVVVDSGGDSGLAVSDAGCAGIEERCGSAECCEGLLCMGPADPLLRRCAAP